MSCSKPLQCYSVVKKSLEVGCCCSWIPLESLVSARHFSGENYVWLRGDWECQLQQETTHTFSGCDQHLFLLVKTLWWTAESPRTWKLFIKNRVSAKLFVYIKLKLERSSDITFLEVQYDFNVKISSNWFQIFLFVIFIPLTHC